MGRVAVAQELVKLARELVASDYIQQGDLILIKGKRYTVVGVQPGRKRTTFNLRPESGAGNFTWKVSNTEYAANTGFVKYLGKDPHYDQKQQAFQQTRQQRDELDQKFVQECRDRLDQLGLQAGDIISYKYRNATRDELVMDLNWKTGKVGISRYDYHGYQDSRELMEKYRGRPVRDIRWLPASGIQRVTTKFKDTFKAEKSYPYAVSSENTRKLMADNYVQIMYRAPGSDVYPYTAVLGMTPEDARKGMDYDGASNNVYFDKQNAFFWRETGAAD